MDKEKYINKSFKILGIEMSIFLSQNKYRHFMFEIEHEDDSKTNWHITIAFPFLIYFNFGIRIAPKLKAKRQLKISYHSKALWWCLWENNDEWHSKTPKWRQGSFHFDDFLFGKSICSKEILEERKITVPMPEKKYPAEAKLMLYTWERPRWFNKKLKRVEIEIPKGIPFEGKGENSWDCGQDACFGITTGECHSIPQGVGILVGSVLKDRVKNGGWNDWCWKK